MCAMIDKNYKINEVNRYLASYSQKRYICLSPIQHMFSVFHCIEILENNFSHDNMSLR